MIFKGKVRDEFNVESIVSAAMESKVAECADIYRGAPDWVDERNGIKTINFAKSICSEVARLTSLAIGINVDGSKRAEYLQSVVNKFYFEIREWVEFACAYGTIVLKPVQDSVEYYFPGDFIVTDAKDGNITGIVFIEKKTVERKHYTKLEYHRFNEGTYWVTNRCYVGNSEGDVKQKVDILNTPWARLLDEVGIANMEGPLYSVLRMPHANNIEPQSPMALSIFSDAIEELKDLDVAYSRNAGEIYDSKRTVLIDSDKMLHAGEKIEDTTKLFNSNKNKLGLPDYVKNVYGDGINSFYQEINPSLNTEVRLTGINALLSQIGFKCGFSNGYFVFNEKTGMITATQVESDDRKTIQLIKDVRDKLECCMDELIYAINVYADLYDLAPVGVYEVNYAFGDITYNFDEDKKQWYTYACQNRIPFWYYLVKFENMTEEEAKELVDAAKIKEPALFGGEE